jgi:hypothetical protein
MGISDVLASDIQRIANSQLPENPEKLASNAPEKFPHLRARVFSAGWRVNLPRQVV